MKGKLAEKGTVLVFVALALPFLILFAGMAIDIGRGYLHKSYMQNAADAAALAGVEIIGGQNARLITEADVPALGQHINSESSNGADVGANQLLALDTAGKWQTGGSNIRTELRKESNLQSNSPLLKERVAKYYYKVELTDEMGFQFAEMFLPEALLPAGWTVKAEAWAAAKNTASALAGVDLYTQMSEEAESYSFATFQDLEARYKGKTYNEIKQMSFTNKGPAYNEDGTRAETFNMDGTSSINNNMRSLLINFKPDLISENKLTDNWDLDKVATMDTETAQAYFDGNNIKITNWRIIGSNGNVLEENEGGISSWGAFYTKLKNLFDADTATALMFSRIGSVINVINPYEVRDLASLEPEEFSYNVYTDEPNELDPLFVRIESEEYNTQSGNKWVTNTIRDISINIKTENTKKSAITGKYLYRPMVFVYDGPVGEDEDGDGIGERGAGRKSRTVTLNLEADFRGIIYAPNSPVHVKGNGHKFQGIIIAQSIVDANDNILIMPAQQSAETDDELQTFYEKPEINLGDAQYDDFGVVRLTKYNNPQKDIFYLKGRAGITI